MGSCYLIVYIIIENQNYNNKCIICWENLSLKTIYIKCTRCNILLHDNCALQYKSKMKTKIYCPHCKSKNSLFRYDNAIYNCKSLSSYN